MPVQPYKLGTTLFTRLLRRPAQVITGHPVIQGLTFSLIPLLLGFGPSVSDLMRPGISRELAAYRTARIANVRYDLTVNVTARDAATGHVVVGFDWHGTGDVILDFRGPALTNGKINGARLVAFENNGAHLRIPAHAVRQGANTLEFDFAAHMGTAGASILRFHDPSDNADYLYTLLVPADANQLFPCFDQPDLKARVKLTLVAPSGWTAVANGALTRTDRGPAQTTFQFAETQPISTYLVAFAAGPWSRVTRTVPGRTITMYVRASRLAEADADSLIAANARGIRWLEEYVGAPLPFAKLDFVLAPAFPVGAMEHPGAIFYNEDRFIFRERPTQAQLSNREEVIYHELAHQWFGNLVTMRWFDDLSLKEGFATYMAVKMQAALNPSADAWKRFYLHHKTAAYAMDLSNGTGSVWQPVDNLDQAKTNYGPIVYSKAPGVLKQLNYLVGDLAFQAGVRRFLATHAYASATWHDLLAAVGAAAHRPLEDWGRQYIFRPGMPVLEQTVSVQNGQMVGVTLRQRPARPLSGAESWPITTELLLVGTDAPRQIPVVLDQNELRVPIPAGTPASAFVFANANDYAYVSVALDTASAHWLVEHIDEIENTLTRAMGWETLWDLVQRGDLPPKQYLATVTGALPRERDEEVTVSLLNHAVRTIGSYASCAQRDSLLPELTRALRRTIEATERPYGVRKANLDALIAVANSGASARYIDALLDRTVPGMALSAATRWAIVTRLIEIGAPTAAQRLAEEKRRDPAGEHTHGALIASVVQPNMATKRTACASSPSSLSTRDHDWSLSASPHWMATDTAH